MKLLYFSRLRQRIGRPEEIVEVPEQIDTVARLVDWLAERDRAYAEAFADRGQLCVAVNQQHSKFSQRISSQDEIAFFPPVTGG